jgi:GNAT superfamily N-acetyltransferase
MLSALRGLIAELGFREAAWYGLGRSLQKWTGAPILFRYALVAQPVAASAILPPRRGRDIEVRILPGPVPEFALLGLDRETLQFRFRQGAVCFGAFYHGALIGCLWVCLGPYEEDEVRCRFSPRPAGGACWDMGLFISPDHRGGVAFGRLWDEANAYLRERGVSVSFSRVGTVNHASIGSHARLGARRIGTATFLCLDRVQIMAATVRPYLHFSLGPASKPHLRLDLPR